MHLNIENDGDSSGMDELRELEMRTGFVNTKTNPMRMPVLKKPSARNVLTKKLTNKTLRFEDGVLSKKSVTKGGGSIHSQ